MPKKSDKPLEKIHFNSYRGDRETLQEFYTSSLGYQAAIRQLVHNHCNKLRELKNRQETPTLSVDVNIDALLEQNDG